MPSWQGAAAALARVPLPLRRALPGLLLALLLGRPTIREFRLWHEGLEAIASIDPEGVDKGNIRYRFEVDGRIVEGLTQLSYADQIALDELHELPFPIVYLPDDPSVSGQPGAGTRCLGLLAGWLVGALTAASLIGRRPAAPGS